MNRVHGGPALGRAIFVAVAAVAVAAVYAGVAGHRFVNFDDPMFLYENGQVRAGWTWAGLAWAWTNKDAVLWQPVTWMAHQAVSALGGMNPAVHLGVNVGLHFVNVLLVAAVMEALTGRRATGAGVALLFAVHPANVEAVAWASQLKTPLSAGLMLGGLLAAVRRAQRGHGSRGPETVAFLGSLLAKPMALALPVVLVVLDRFPLRAGEPVSSPLGWRGAIRNRWPLFAAAAFVLVMTLVPWVRAAAPDLAAPGGMPSLGRLVALPVIVVHHLALWFWPVGLAVYYPPEIPAWPAIVGAGLLLAALTAGAWVMRQRLPAALAGWAWFLLMLLPAAGAWRPGQHDVADRYLYLAGLGPALVVVELVACVAAAQWRRAGFAVLAAVIVLLGVLARAQAGHWCDSVALWSRAEAVTPPSALQQLNLGAALLAAGRLDEARERLVAAAALQPANPRAHVNLAVIAQLRGDLPAARDGFARALALVPEDARVMSNLGSVLADLGETARGRDLLERAVRARPDLVEAWINLGVLRAQAGEFAPAREAFEAAAALRPGDATIAQNLELLRRQAAPPAVPSRPGS